MTSATHIDLYQLTSLIPHYDAGLMRKPVVMNFFSRRLPRDPRTDEPVRGYLLFAGLTRCLQHLQQARFSDQDLSVLRQHPMIGPALNDRPELVEALRTWRFHGQIRAPQEGSVLFAGQAKDASGRAIDVQGVKPAATCPYLAIETDLLTAKFIETPLLSILNHMTMVASKASVVARAAQRAGPGRSVLEFGQRRTHPEAAVDAAVAAYIGGAAATSNVAAHVRWGLPIAGTMDHFAIQAWERKGQPRHETERAYFTAFHRTYPGSDTLLVDTYDTFGALTGIRNAVAAAAPESPWGIRLDSDITHDNIWRARRLLDELGAKDTRIFVSGGMDEHAIDALGDAPVDGYGVGERIVTSPDAPVGVGAVAKLSMMDGEPTMKLSRGSGKATLPGRLQVWRTEHGDTVGLIDEALPGTPLLHTVWSRDHGPLPLPSLRQARQHAIDSLANLPTAQLVPREATMTVSKSLQELIARCVDSAT